MESLLHMKNRRSQKITIAQSLHYKFLVLGPCIALIFNWLDVHQHHLSRKNLLTMCRGSHFCKDLYEIRPVYLCLPDHSFGTTAIRQTFPSLEGPPSLRRPFLLVSDPATTGTLDEVSIYNECERIQGCRAMQRYRFHQDSCHGQRLTNGQLPMLTNTTNGAIWANGEL